MGLLHVEIHASSTKCCLSLNQPVINLVTVHKLWVVVVFINYLIVECSPKVTKELVHLIQKYDLLGECCQKIK